MSLLALAIALALLLGLSAWLATAEHVVLELGSAELQQLGLLSPRALDRVLSFRSDSRALLSALWTGSAFLHVGLMLSFSEMARKLWPQAWLGVAGGGLVLWLLFCTQVLPSWVSGLCALRLARFSAEPLFRLSRLLLPVGRPLRRGLESLWRRMGVSGPRTLTEEEFLTGVEVGGRQGVLRDEVRSMVQGILDLEKTQASEVMTPRVDLVGVPADATAEEWAHVARGVHFRHLPVYRGSMDTVEGMLDVVRFLLDPSGAGDAHVERPLFVPETAPLHELLETFQQRGVRSAVVLDEYGGTAGMITRGDILEEITTDVTGEYAPESPSLQALGDGSWLVDGRTNLEDINDALEFMLDAEESDRIAGWATEHAGSLLKVGDRVEAQGCRATIRRTRKHAILQLQLERLPPGSSALDAPGDGAPG